MSELKKFRLVNIKAEGRIIKLYVRDEEGKKKIIKVTDFYPYFYSKNVPTTYNQKWIVKVESGFKTLFGEEVYKIYVEHPGLVPKIRRPDDYEADIPYVRRFMIDTGIRDYFYAPDRSEISWKEIRPADEFE